MLITLAPWTVDLISPPGETATTLPELPAAAGRGLAHLLADEIQLCGWPEVEVRVADGALTGAEDVVIGGTFWASSRHLQCELQLSGGVRDGVFRHSVDAREGFHLLSKMLDFIAARLDASVPGRVTAGFEDYRTASPAALLAYWAALEAPWEAARRLLVRAYELDPRFPAVPVTLALDAVQRGDSEAAARLLAGVPVGHSNWARDLGTGLWAAGEPAVAAELLAAAIRNDADDGLAHAALAALLARRGESEEALYLATRASQLEPDDYRVWSALGDVYRTRGDFEQACFYYGFALRLEASAPALLKDAAACWILARQPERALPLLQRAIAAAPTDPDNHGNLAFAHNLLGESREALEAARVAVGMDGSRAPLWVLRGDLAWKVGLVEEARAAWGQATTLDPSLQLNPQGGNIGVPEKMETA